MATRREARKSRGKAYLDKQVGRRRLDVVFPFQVRLLRLGAEMGQRGARVREEAEQA